MTETPAPVPDTPPPAPPPAGDGYQVRLEIFEGPLDLLLFLIRKKKVDIHDIPIAAITRDYLGYLERKDRINLDREAEFVFIASLLIFIKSQMLLPRETDYAESEDPRRVLVDRLLEYQKVKAACSLLRDREDVQLHRWRRTFLPPLPGGDELETLEVSLFDLAETFFRILKRKEAETTRVIKGRDVSLETKTRDLLASLAGGASLDFNAYFEGQETVADALMSFFALLELVKSHLVYAVQDDLFQTIRVWMRRDRTPGHKP